jgi:hypothetical protein
MGPPRSAITSESECISRERRIFVDVPRAKREAFRLDHWPTLRERLPNIVTSGMSGPPNVSASAASSHLQAPR